MIARLPVAERNLEAEHRQQLDHLTEQTKDVLVITRDPDTARLWVEIGAAEDAIEIGSTALDAIVDDQTDILLDGVARLPDTISQRARRVRRLQWPADARNLSEAVRWSGQFPSPAEAPSLLEDLARILWRCGFEDVEKPDTPTAPKARVRSWSEFRQQSDFRFRMRGWLPTKGVAVLGAAEHTGKSILAVDWALRCVLGDAVEDWCGHTVRQPCSSLYVIGEDAQGIMLRTEAFIEERVTGAFGAQFAETLTCDGRTIDFVDRMPGPLAEPVGMLELRRLIEDFETRHGHRPGIVWLDTSSTLYGGDENDNGAMGQFAKELSEIADEFDLLIVLIHHLRKPSSQGNRSVRPSGADLRGAGCIAGDFDVVLLVWRKDHEDRLSPVEVFVHKGKNGGTTGAGHWLGSRWVSLRKNEDGDDIGAPILSPCERPAKETEEDEEARRREKAEAAVPIVVATLAREFGASGVPMPRESIAAASGVRLTTARAAVDLAHARGKIRIAGGTKKSPLFAPVAKSGSDSGEGGDPPYPPDGTGRDARGVLPSRDGTGRDGT